MRIAGRDRADGVGRPSCQHVSQQNKGLKGFCWPVVGPSQNTTGCPGPTVAAAPSQKSPLPSPGQGPLLRMGDWLGQRQLDSGPRVKANKSLLSYQHSCMRSR